MQECFQTGRTEIIFIVVIRKWLKNNCSDSEQKLKTGKVGRPEGKDVGSVRDIARWLNLMVCILFFFEFHEPLVQVVQLVGYCYQNQKFSFFYCHSFEVVWFVFHI